MMRPFYTWIIFVLCLVLATAAMGYVSWTALRLDRAEALARRQAEHEENVRLALWRMDSALAQLIAQESARPYFVYTSFYPAERAYNRMFEPEADEVLLPSPLLTFSSPSILVHFQIGPDGAITSPQTPRAQMRELALSTYCEPERISGFSGQLAQLAGRISREPLLASLPEPPPVSAEMAALPYMRQQVQSIGNQYAYGQNAPVQQAAEPQQAISQKGGKVAPQEQQFRKSSQEYSARTRQTDNNLNILGNNTKAVPLPSEPSIPVSEGAMRPMWNGDLLLLARRVSVKRVEYLQGCVLNWPGIRQSLLADVVELLPHARLEPVRANAGGDRSTQMLAALPVRLFPGPLVGEPDEGVTPIRVSLGIAWACVLLAAAAIGALLMGAVRLSERRGAFVSAVTHELRTPLTTLRMYTEMLAEGMVPTEEQRRSYLQTLRAEADRLGHLVENVLAYSRIERGRARGHVVDVPLRELIDRAHGRLAERAAQGGMNLVVEPATEAGRQVRADPSAVEQILFNLVDNACKYAAGAGDRSIHLEAAGDNGRASIRVRDHGPGIPPQDGRRLFRPFSKSARDAANSAPGVGLGLALSRRLAREMGGELRHEAHPGGGASFLLSLPTS